MDTSVKHLSPTASSSSDLLLRNDDCLECTPPGSRTTYYSSGPFDSWILLHLDTLLIQGSIIHPQELGQLELTDTPEQVHIAKARLALYDSLAGEETQRIEPDPQLLKMFLKSKDYVVCTGAFRWCLNLVTISQPDAAGMFIPVTVGYEWIEHLIQVLCGYSGYERVRSWEFLTEHLVPKWAMLPPSWCSAFASAFLFSNVNPSGMPELHAYQSFAETLSDWARPIHVAQLHLFLPFLITALKLTKAELIWYQLTSIENWLAHLPEILENQDAHAQLENILATRRQELVEETIGSFAELPMADSSDLQ